MIDDDDSEVASTRSGLRELYREAMRASKLLVVSRLSNEKVLPWMVSSSGAVRCYDTVSLSQKLSLHRHALRPILIHVFMWDRMLNEGIAASRFSRPASPPQSQSLMPLPLPVPAEIRLPRTGSEKRVVPLPPPPEGDAVGPTRLERDTAGEMSFRFHNFSLGNNWV